MSTLRTALVLSFLFLLLLGSISASAQDAKKASGVVRLASTIGPIDAGIVGALEEAFGKKTGIAVRHVGAGTGEALKIAQTGDFDLVLVHARALEEKFVAEGYGTKRYDLMYNDFVIVGPEGDPVRIAGERSAKAALRQIAEQRSPFITRGDRSGTHVKEVEVWQAAAINPAGPWYEVYEHGKEGNSRTLKYVNERQAYTLIDRATYITLKQQITLKVLVENDPLLLNYITLIPVSPAKFPGVNHGDAMRFVEFTSSAEGQRIIRDFGKDKYGEPLFFPNSPAGRSLQ